MRRDKCDGPDRTGPDNRRVRVVTWLIRKISGGILSEGIRITIEDALPSPWFISWAFRDTPLVTNRWLGRAGLWVGGRAPRTKGPSAIFSKGPFVGCARSSNFV